MTKPQKNISNDKTELRRQEQNFLFEALPLLVHFSLDPRSSLVRYSLVYRRPIEDRTRNKQKTNERTTKKQRENNEKTTNSYRAATKTHQTIGERRKRAIHWTTNNNRTLDLRRKTPQDNNSSDNCLEFRERTCKFAVSIQKT